MPITDYASLRQAVIDWPSLSGEQDLEQYVDTVISLEERAGVVPPYVPSDMPNP